MIREPESAIIGHEEINEDDSNYRLQQFQNFKNQYKIPTKRESANHSKKVSLRGGSIFGNAFSSKDNNSHKNYQIPEVLPQLTEPSQQKGPNELNTSFRKYRLDRMVKLFAFKLKQNIIFRTPPQLEHSKEGANQLERFFGDKEGLDQNNFLSSAVSFASFLICLALLLFYTVQLAFASANRTGLLMFLQLMALIVFSFEILLKMFVKTYDKGKTIIEISKIIPSYLRNDFKFDILVVACILFNIFSDSSVARCARILLVIKIPFILDVMEIIKNMVCINNQREQQWGLIMVFCTNFIFAHMISVVLICMADLDPHNWLVQYGISDEPEMIQYAYAYYWATNIMLTVGFGDISAANWKEAVIVVVIEMSGCITLAYNINCVGNLLTNLRAQDLQKNKNIKTFNRMASENGFMGKEIEARVKQYIEKSFEIKKIFNIQNEKETLTILPQKLRIEYLKKANHKILEKVDIFNEFSKKVLELIAVRLEKSLTHPEEIIMRKGEKCKLFILSQGEVAFISQQQKRGKNESIVVQKLSCNRNACKVLVSFTNFIKNQDQRHTVMATAYSVLYSIQQKDFEDAMRMIKLDFEKFCYYRDRDRFDEYSTQLKCSICNNKSHSKFDCPRIHYSPLKQIVSLKSRKKDNSKQKKRIKYKRRTRMHFIFIEYEDSQEQKNVNVGRKRSFLIEGEYSENSGLPFEGTTFERGNKYRLTMQSTGARSRVDLAGESLKSLSNVNVNEEVDRMFHGKFYFPKFNIPDDGIFLKDKQRK